MIDWLKFLDSNRIDYVDFGPNVQKGNVNIACPFCENDPSHHLGINPDSGFWGCWRDSSHRGRKPHRLIMKLIKCSYLDVEEMIQESSNLDTGKVVNLFSNPEEIFTVGNNEAIGSFSENKQLRFYPEFRELENIGVGKRFFDYLRFNRKFGDITQETIDMFNLHYAVTGKMLTRIIFPYYNEEKLVTWSGRTIIPNSLTKYKALASVESVIKTTDTLFGIDNVPNITDIIIITEGPIDVAKLAVVGRDIGIGAVGLSTKTVTEEQKLYINNLSLFTKRLIVILDRGEEFHSAKIVSELSHIKNIEFLPFPKSSRVHDFGDMRQKQLVEFLSSLKG